MAQKNSDQTSMHIGRTVMVVMMDVDPEHEDDFHEWYNVEHVAERLGITGYVSARRFKLEEGEGMLKYLCIWEMDDSSPLRSDEYKAQRARPSELRDKANAAITKRARGVYTQIFPEEGAYEDHSGYDPAMRDA